MRQASVNALSKTKKKAMLASLDELGERMPSLLNIDHPCAQRQIVDARHAIEVCICIVIIFVFFFFSFIIYSNLFGAENHKMLNYAVYYVACVALVHRFFFFQII